MWVARTSQKDGWNFILSWDAQCENFGFGDSGDLSKEKMLRWREPEPQSIGLGAQQRLVGARRMTSSPGMWREFKP